MGPTHLILGVVRDSPSSEPQTTHGWPSVVVVEMMLHPKAVSRERWWQRPSHWSRSARCSTSVMTHQGGQAMLGSVAARVAELFTRGLPLEGWVENSPDNLTHNACSEQAAQAQMHNAYAVDTPKMPGEPPRCNPHVRTV